MVNFNKDLFDTWEDACEQISKFSGVCLGYTDNKRLVYQIITSDVLYEISNNYPDIFINVSHGHRNNSFSIFNEDHSILINRTMTKNETTLKEVIFNGLLEFIQRYKDAKCINQK
jgi:hypothetical protein